MNAIQKKPNNLKPATQLYKESLRIIEIQEAIQAGEVGKVVSFEPTHTFSGGVYIREITIPTGVVIMGERHRGETCNILLRGELSIYAGDDEQPLRIKGPFMFTSAPNTKKFAYCHEEAVFLNIFPWDGDTSLDEENIEHIEKQLIIPEEEYRLILEGDIEKEKIEEGETQCL